MRLRDFLLLTDQNIHADVVAYLRSEGFDVLDAEQAKVIGVSDSAILAQALADSRVVVTHDADFGTLAIQQGLPFTGIVYLRPGHVKSQPTIDSLKQLLTDDPALQTPFLIVVKRTAAGAAIRVRIVTP